MIKYIVQRFDHVEKDGYREKKLLQVQIKSTEKKWKEIMTEIN